MQYHLQENSAKNCQSLFNFHANSISPVCTIYSFLNIDDFMKSKQRKVIRLQLSIHTVYTDIPHPGGGRQETVGYELRQPLIVQSSSEQCTTASHQLANIIGACTDTYVFYQSVLEKKKDRLVRCIAKDVMSHHRRNVTSQTPVVSMTTGLIILISVNGTN